MGGSCSAELADLRMYEILENILYQCTHKNKFYFALDTDDGFILYQGEIEEIQQLFNLANDAHVHLKFTYEFSQHEITFLDTVIYKGKQGRRLHTLPRRD